MDGFKNTTKTVYLAGGGAVKGDAGAAKMAKVMHEFKTGTLHSGSKHGPEVTNRKQAIAIAINQASKAPVKKADGGVVRLPVDPDARDEGVMRSPRPPAAPPRSLLEARAQKAVAAEPRTALDRKLSTLPSQRGEMQPGYAKGGSVKKPSLGKLKDLQTQAQQAVTAEVMRKSDRAAAKGVPVAPSSPLIGAKHGGLAVKKC